MNRCPNCGARKGDHIRIEWCDGDFSEGTIEEFYMDDAVSTLMVRFRRTGTSMIGEMWRIGDEALSRCQCQPIDDYYDSVITITRKERKLDLFEG